MTSATLWMGAVQPSWDAAFIQTCFQRAIQESVKVKVFINSSFPKRSIGYAFVEFQSPATARRAKETLQGKLIPGTNVLFRLNWATRNKKKIATIRDKSETSLFVGDLAPTVSDEVLLNAFKEKFPSCSEANVIIDPVTGHSKKYGFVRFKEKADYDLALSTMNGFMIASRAIRVDKATVKKRGSASLQPSTGWPHILLNSAWIPPVPQLPQNDYYYQQRVSVPGDLFNPQPSSSLISSLNYMNQPSGQQGNPHSYTLKPYSFYSVYHPPAACSPNNTSEQSDE